MTPRHGPSIVGATTELHRNPLLGFTEDDAIRPDRQRIGEPSGLDNRR
jgi:hypothetical protein